MIENTQDALEHKVLSCFARGGERYDDAYWRVLLPYCCGSDSIVVYDELIAKGFISNNYKCFLTKKGLDRLRDMDDLEYKESDAEIEEDEKCALQTCLRSTISSDTPIFRYIHIDNFYRMLEQGENALAHFSKWEDPFEGYIFKGVTLGLDKKFLDLHTIYSTYYGQCWTLDGDESDMRWRACGARGTVVRIESTVGMLFESLRQIEPKNYLHISVKLGCVEYRPENELLSAVSNKSISEIVDGHSDPKPGDLLFWKRKEFESEKEFRIVLDATSYRDYRNGTNLKFLNGMAVYKVPFEMIVKSVLVDPCMSQGNFDQLLCRMKIHNPNSTIAVTQSTLFKWPNFRASM